ncbi:hypothetical protein ElyMa_002051600 [Elysia marginata]|uniref:Uncharacterized protein n=1 Tax=Elysia marginata TaxID=1093978 RepID=A0AAV4F939_9GAST|nr:hypothetical protein ElyMa_002051600 [Elysia marginata]
MASPLTSWQINLRNEGIGALLTRSSAEMLGPSTHSGVRRGNKAAHKPGPADSAVYCYLPNVHVACMNHGLRNKTRKVYADTEPSKQQDTVVQQIKYPSLNKAPLKILYKLLFHTVFVNYVERWL